MVSIHGKHEFALYVPTLTAQVAAAGAHAVLVVDDAALAHRVQHVLRLNVGESVCLFDRHMYAESLVHALNKKSVSFIVDHSAQTMPLLPTVTFFLPLLKKDDLEMALYSLVELGANRVQLVTTEKSRQCGSSWKEAYELERLERVMIAAAEQSKQFVIPELVAPISFAACIEQIKQAGSLAIFFDPDGQELLSVLHTTHEKKPTALALLVGPEGDLTAHEKKQLANAQVQFCALTPTVVRSVQAVAVGMGAFRSVLR